MTARAIELHVRFVEHELRVSRMIEVRALERLARRMTTRAVGRAVDSELSDVRVDVTRLAARAFRPPERASARRIVRCVTGRAIGSRMSAL